MGSSPDDGRVNIEEVREWRKKAQVCKAFVEPESAMDDALARVDALLSEIDRLKVREKRGFMQGYVCACATLQRAHGADTYTEELLNCFGRVDWKQIDEFDREALKGFMAPRRVR